MARANIVSAALIFFVCTNLVTGVRAADSDSGKKILMVIVDRVAFEDIEGLPNFKGLIDGGSIALMNNRASGTAAAGKSYVTLGSGIRAEGAPSSLRALEVDRQTAEVFYRRTGINVTEGMVVNTEINRLTAQNAKGEYGAAAGNIGHYLHENNLKTAVLGNGDCGDNQIRWAVSIAMDRNGVVDFGKVEQNVLAVDPLFPTGYRTDFDRVISYLDLITGDGADFIVIETGDMTRIEETRDLLNQTMYDFHRQNALLGIEAFLGEIKKRADAGGWLVMIVTPYPSEAGISKGDRLTPLIVYGDEFPAGLLTSGTTRREGIAANIDVASTVTEYFGIAGEDIVGRPLKGVPGDNNLQRLKQINSMTVATSNNRYPILSNYAVFVIAVVLAGMLSILYPGIMGGRLAEAEKFLLIAIMVFPFVLLVLPALKLQTLSSTAASIILGVALLTFLAHNSAGTMAGRILIVSGITSLAIILDVATGAHLLSGSLLGYDPIIGARYYGIGNEYMGVVAGSSLVMASSLMEEKRTGLLTIGILLAVIIIVVGYPALGANFGGTITCFAAFSFYLLRLSGIKIGIKHITAMGIGLVAIISGFLLFDLLFLESHSHLAAAIMETVNKGPQHLAGIINRKVSMNIKLLRYTVWTKVLITVIAVTGVLFYRPVGIFKKAFAKHPFLAKGWSAIVVAAAVGMAVNDSGVVTSATGSIFFVASMLYVLIGERNPRGDGNEAVGL